MPTQSTADGFAGDGADHVPHSDNPAAGPAEADYAFDGFRVAFNAKVALTPATPAVSAVAPHAVTALSIRWP